MDSVAEWQQFKELTHTGGDAAVNQLVIMPRLKNY